MAPALSKLCSLAKILSGIGCGADRVKINYLKKIGEYFFVGFLVAAGFGVYYQVSMYPYKVDRWLQPLEAKVVSAVTLRCSPAASWLSLMLEHAEFYQGAYSAQAAFIDTTNKLHGCEIGYKDHLFGIRVNAAARYRYASASKLITTAAIVGLANNGVISKADRLVSFFPELGVLKDPRVGEITIEHLLNHSAGFDRLTHGGDPMFSRKSKPWCPRDLSQLQGLTLSFNPGEAQVYSNLGYCLLGEVIHRVSGESYREYISREFLLSSRNIKFIDDRFYGDEVRYDYRYEDWYNNSYLSIFDFDSISSVAGLSGSADALARLLRDIHTGGRASPFVLGTPAVGCKLQEAYGCLSGGLFHYQPEKGGLLLHFHEGYLPGVATVAVIDSYGGVTVLVKSGANRAQQSSNNEWVQWIYSRLSLYYTMQGGLPILEEASTRGGLSF